LTGPRPSFWATLVPPGSSSLVGGVLGLAGIQASVQAQQTFAEGEALWSLVTRGWEPFLAACTAIPDPPWTVWLVNTLWAALLLVGTGGWIRVMVDDASGDGRSESTWREGLQRSPVAILTWLTGLMASGLLLFGAALVPLSLFRAQQDGRFPSEDWASGALWGAGSVLTLAIVWLALVCLAVATLAAIHRVAAPGGPPALAHARRLFKHGRGGKVLASVVITWFGWCAVREAIAMSLPLLAAGSPLAGALPGPLAHGWAVVGALLCVGINLADAVLVLWTLREACHLYARTPVFR